MHFDTGKSHDMLCHACRPARRDTLVTTGATRTTRVQGHHHSVDWGGHVHLIFFKKLFLRLMQIQSSKDLTFTREQYCFFVVRRVGTSTARHARNDTRDMSCMSCRDVTQQVEFWAIVALLELLIISLSDGGISGIEVSLL